MKFGKIHNRVGCSIFAMTCAVSIITLSSVAPAYAVEPEDVSTNQSIMIPDPNSLEPAAAANTQPTQLSDKNIWPTKKDASGTPALTITYSDDPSAQFPSAYERPKVVPEIYPEEVLNNGITDQTLTIVGRKIGEIREDMFSLQSEVSNLSKTLSHYQADAEVSAADYYANIGTINAQLRAGTTPGNPRLVQRLAAAQSNLEKLATNVTEMNVLSVEIARLASVSNYLLEATRVSYNLSGAVEEDHVALSELEDSINNTMVVIERLMNNINDSITRTTTYLSSERSNLRTLSLAVSQGDLYGKSLSNRPFSNLSLASFTPEALKKAKPPAMKPLVKIKFNKPDVQYEQPVYVAVSQALERYPAARISLVAVFPTGANSAKTAIESTRARRNAEKVLRTLTQMGVSLDRIDMSYMPSTDIQSNEVRIYIQ